MGCRRPQAAGWHARLACAAERQTQAHLQSLEPTVKHSNHPRRDHFRCRRKLKRAAALSNRKLRQQQRRAASARRLRAAGSGGGGDG